MSENFLNMFFQNYQAYSEERVTTLYSANNLKFNCYNHYYFLGLATFLHVIFRYYLWYDVKKIVSWGTRTIFCSNIIFNNNSTSDLTHFCMCSLGSIHDTLGKDMLPLDPRTTLSSMIQIISNSICDWTHFFIILFDITKDTLRKGILSMIRWWKRYYPEIYDKIFSSISQIIINSICELPKFCICSFDTTKDKLRKKTLTWDPRTTLSSQTQTIINSMCDLPHFLHMFFRYYQTYAEKRDNDLT